MKWRNAEGREFPACSDNKWASVGAQDIRCEIMGLLGYELVEDSVDQVEFECGYTRFEKPDYPEGDWIAIYLCDVPKEAKDALMALNKPGCFAKRIRVSVVSAEQVAEIPSGSPHAFVGRHDRDCEVCGLPDRAPIHRGFAERVGAPSANDESARLSQRDVLRLLGAFNQVQQEFLDKIRKVSKPPQNPPTEAVSVGTEGADEFEVVCVENREASERWPHLTPVLIHVGLIPGKTYLVREKR